MRRSKNFNPRTPYGMRQMMTMMIGTLKIRSKNFNPRTPYGMRQRYVCCVSIIYVYFNPRTPYGMRHCNVAQYCPFYNFNPRTPYGMRRLCKLIDDCNKNFNPRTPYGMRHKLCIGIDQSYKFQSTHPLRDATRNAYDSISRV